MQPPLEFLLHTIMRSAVCTYCVSGFPACVRRCNGGYAGGDKDGMLLNLTCSPPMARGRGLLGTAKLCRGNISLGIGGRYYLCFKHLWLKSLDNIRTIVTCTHHLISGGVSGPTGPLLGACSDWPPWTHGRFLVRYASLKFMPRFGNFLSLVRVSVRNASLEDQRSYGRHK